MTCPHCGVAVHEDFEEFPLFDRQAGENYRGWEIEAQLCPACGSPIIYLTSGRAQYTRNGEFQGVNLEQSDELSKVRVWPHQSSRSVPAEVPAGLKEDYAEAASVLSISPKASAALSRRCLQHLLREYALTKSKNLADQINEIIQEGKLSSHLCGQLDAVRNIGKFAAHPQKDSATGEILPVEPHEAEWNLDVLDELFDHYFVKPSRNRERVNELNKKLAAASKPLMPVD